MLKKKKKKKKYFGQSRNEKTKGWQGRTKWMKRMPLFANQLLIKLDENREKSLLMNVSKNIKKNQERTELKKRIHPCSLNVG